MADDLPFPGTPDRSNDNNDQVERHQLLTRTIAILAGVACNTHRLAIQARITQNGFSILSERLEEWSLQTDQDFLREFFRDEEKQDVWMRRLTGAPIYVMILERHRAAEMWLDMCGPDLEGEEERLDEDGLPLAKTGLRASYGAGSLYGSSTSSASRQIAICFPDLASIQAIEALNEETEAPSTYAAVGSDGGFLVREDDDIVYDEDGKAFDAHSGQPIELQQELVVNVRSPMGAEKSQEGSRVFKARPLPSNKQPTIKPRLSKAAALRMGVALPEPPKRAMSNSSSNDASLGISGLPRSGVALPKSLMAPSIAPRLNKVAAARTKTLSSPEAVPKTIERERKEIDYSNVPGHKRMSLSSSRPASLAAPTVAPRLNKAAAARLSGTNNATEKGTGSFRQSRPAEKVETTSTPRTSSIDYSNTPGHKRMSLPGGGIKSLQAPSLAPRTNRASQARTSVGVPSKPAPTPAKVAGDAGRVTNGVGGGKENLFVNTPGHKRASGNFSIASLAQPTIVPRSNASAMKRLSMGGVNGSGDGQKGASVMKETTMPRARPASVIGSSTPSKIITNPSRSSRPSSRASLSSAHQDGVPPRSSIRAKAAPPSSFRF